MTEYRIDDLARAAGTTTRNVRGYQDRGLLPRPTRRGRIAIYTDTHLARLKVINDLLHRGFTIRHIADFLLGVQRGDDLVDVLGIREVVTEPWSKARSETISAEALKSLLNSRNPSHYKRLEEFGLIEAAGDDYVLRDRETVYAFGRLTKLGLTLSKILDVHGKVEKEMAAVASTLISAGRDVVESERGEGWVPSEGSESDWAAELIGEMRRTATISAHSALDRALDRDLAHQLDDYLRNATD
ncbi:MerR family transcriptional regulator [Williamsia sp. DF01-3]|uniref:MerR family transcriptional regulator n=1 Tax=Williamsia sp. DF01-3 TaxID=2934157 RepID=UPI001FF2F699|nr:MerR family transcriptional regulator [Williamsia sp. DF01-3]MCK0520317.1 MerR family transcriptional regulator [Williamsia sp. DF01-3]